MCVDNVTITGTTANLGTEHTMTCMVGVDSTGLEYEWRVGTTLLQARSLDNTYVFQMVSVRNGRDDYRCNVFRGENTVGSATASLQVTSKTPSPACFSFPPNFSSPLHSLFSPFPLPPPPHSSFLRDCLPLPSTTVPDFDMRFSRMSGVSSINYVGLNVSYVCSTLFPNTLGSDLAGNVDILGPDNTPIQEGSGRVRTSMVTKFRNNYERTLYLSPLSVSDTGEYTCTGTISSAVTNSLVISGRSKDRQRTITVQPIPVLSECDQLECR